MRISGVQTVSRLERVKRQGVLLVLNVNAPEIVMSGRLIGVEFQRGCQGSVGLIKPVEVYVVDAQVMVRRRILRIDFDSLQKGARSAVVFALAVQGYTEQIVQFRNCGVDLERVSELLFGSLRIAVLKVGNTLLHVLPKGLHLIRREWRDHN